MAPIREPKLVRGLVLIMLYSAMIAIISRRHLELSTCQVISWLKYFNKDFIRINGEDVFEQKVRLSDDWLKDVRCVWYRRGLDYSFWVNKKSDYIKSTLDIFDHSSTYTLLDYFVREISSYSSYFYGKLAHAHWLTKVAELSVNKLMVLDAAHSVGLDVPRYIVTNNKSDVENFISKYGRAVSKSMSDMGALKFEKKYIRTLTYNIDLSTLPDIFFPSLVQKYIDKEYEIRTFYLENCFYSMAIFSQSNAKTMIDYRNYDWEKPNRQVPVMLPNDITSKLQKLMTVLHITTCSIDIIKGSDGNYYFLEVNPVGQFGMVSFPTNFYLERTVAKHLIKHSN
jgi:ATP-GRASP peptide maturase of grasp-with-spasm system